MLRREPRHNESATIYVTTLAARALLFRRRMKNLLALTALPLLLVCCAATEESEDLESTESAVRIDRTISGSYGITTFGGPGDLQSQTACGLKGQGLVRFKWYVASSQRYKCHTRLRLTTASGKCVVVSAEDAGPASWVEDKAGMKILDASPDVARYLFGVGGLGWSDLKRTGTKYQVDAQVTQLPVGPCDASAVTPVEQPVASDTPVIPEVDDAPDPPVTTPAARECGSDGACNPGNDGSGKICEGGKCVPGCRVGRSPWICPGTTTCIAGTCQ